MYKYIIMGSQGSGKGTQAKLLASKLDLVHICVGDIFRWHISNHTKLAARIKRTIANGQLVDDETVGKVVKNRLDIHDWNFGFILDGFPRNRPQAEFFLESYDIDAVILLELSEETIMQRIESRRLCEKCGLDYNLIFHRTPKEGICDVCGGRLIAREDDRPDAIRQRLDDYRTMTQPIIDLFRQKELVIPIDSGKPAEAVHLDILLRLGVDGARPAEPMK